MSSPSSKRRSNSSAVFGMFSLISFFLCFTCPPNRNDPNRWPAVCKNHCPKLRSKSIDSRDTPQSFFRSVLGCEFHSIRIIPGSFRLFKINTMFRLIRTALLRIVFENHFRPAVGLRYLLVLTIVFRRSLQSITVPDQRINLGSVHETEHRAGVRAMALCSLILLTPTR